MSDVDDEQPVKRSRARDFWQLDLPLAVVLTLCAVITVIEYTRATEGVWRAWIYLFEWPMIGAFAIWIWYRFKHESGGGFVRRWRERVAAMAPDAADLEGAPAPPPEPADLELEAWRAYQRSVRDADPTPPPGPGAAS